MLLLLHAAAAGQTLYYAIISVAKENRGMHHHIAALPSLLIPP